MDRVDEFRRYAEEARQKAFHARTEDERATWLQLAEGWLGLLESAQKKGQQGQDRRTSSKQW